MTREEGLKYIKKLMNKINEAQIAATELTKKEMKKVVSEISAKPGSGGWDRH